MTGEQTVLKCIFRVKFPKYTYTLTKEFLTRIAKHCNCVKVRREHQLHESCTDLLQSSELTFYRIVMYPKNYTRYGTFPYFWGTKN